MNYNKILYCAGSVMILSFLLIKNNAQSAKKIAIRPIAVTDCSKVIGLAKVVCLAESFKASLNKDQAALLQRAYSKTDAVRWSNFPQAFSRPNRVGLSIGSLNPQQLAAFKALMESVLVQNITNAGYDQLEGIRMADDELAKATGKSDTFGAGNYFIAFLGTPSETNLWQLQYGGHHYAFADTYSKGAIIGTTPSFRGVEPMKQFTANSRAYQPMVHERDAFAALISGLNDTEKSAAKLSATFSDILLGPGQDAGFPNKKEGVKASALSPSQQKLLIKAIGFYVNDLDAVTAKAIMKKYTAALPDTYLAFSGSGTMNQTADYIRIDGPGVWIEYAVQPSRDFPNTTHPHSIWRDHQSDYGGN